MKTLCSGAVATVLILASVAVLTLHSSPADGQTPVPVTVVEYRNKTINAYFVTGRASEQATLDALPTIFERTGMSFAAVSAGTTTAPKSPVCRYRLLVDKVNNLNSHFYGLPADCAALADAVARNNLENIFYEDLDFGVTPPTAATGAGGEATCAAAAPVAIYRSFRARNSITGGGKGYTPNHRYSVSRASYEAMSAEGDWNGEGVVFCTTSATSLAAVLTFTESPLAVTTEPFARFAFNAPTSIGYECSVNGGTFTACNSTHTVIAQADGMTPLLPGAHRFAVRPIFADGSRGPEVMKTWTITTVFGAAGQPLIATNQVPTPAANDGWLAIYRINCDFNTLAYDDPVVFPNMPCHAHLHDFYGNKLLDAYSTAESIYTKGGSSCQGDTLNRSAYWVPVLLAPNNGANSSNGFVVVKPKVGDDAVAHELFYYSIAVADLNSVKNFPVGLRMIAGTGSTQPGNPQATSIARWHCLSWQASDGANPVFVPYIPECGLQDQVRFDIFFPSCWNGTALDSSDHKSHMAYPITDGGRNNLRCPDSHPVPLPRASYHYSFPVLPGNADRVTQTSKGWRLASDNFTVNGTTVKGGWSLHGDWFNGWHPEVMQAIIDQCLKRGFDCHDGNIANGWRLGGVSKGAMATPEIINHGMGSHAGH
jgi:hypothetical protein